MRNAHQVFLADPQVLGMSFAVLPLLIISQEGSQILPGRSNKTDR